MIALKRLLKKQELKDLTGFIDTVQWWALESTLDFWFHERQIMSWLPGILSAS
jgi:hypothetical protein